MINFLRIKEYILKVLGLIKMQKTEKQLLEDRLKELLINKKKEEGIVVSLKGKWGVGKTHFWKDLIDNELKNNNELKYAYISLFGKNSLDEIKKEIILKISIKDKVLGSISGSLKNIKTTFGLKEDDNSFGITGTLLGSLVSLVEKKDFKNVLICFDDFERLSASLNIKDILGFISELKEQKNCKILMINNNNELKKSDVHNYQNIMKDDEKLHYVLTNTNLEKIFEDYREKIIDFEFEYSFNDFDEKFNNLYKIDIFDNEFILNEIKKNADNLEIENIRLLKQYISNLELFLQYFQNKKISKLVKQILIVDIMIYSYEVENFQLINWYGKIDSTLIIDSLKKGYILEKDYLHSNLEMLSQKLSAEKSNFDIANKLHKIPDKFSFEVNYTKEEYIKDLKECIIGHEDILLEVISLDNLKYYLNELDKYSSEFNIKNILDECAKKYIDKIFKDGFDAKKHMHNSMIQQIQNENPHLNKYVEEKRSEALNINGLSEEEIIKNYHNPQEKSSWGIEEEILNSINLEKHIKFMKKSPQYFEEAFEFARWINRFNGKKPFEKTYQNIIEAINIISSENEEMKAKMERIKNIIDKWDDNKSI
ncbi:P-loop NTPase fold protein [Halarcobacter anaerophilus]|uniref:KAP NTPase domain-containing protein n=1 Tax=Halarcobacter anaerophilus TaxID=877500 RepID=A0A4V1LQ41_9BACT|nr:P-loop NTPase fold protein [Halarcobacter anaerophilus]QDF28658.1 hypothetical protein AANAER_1172 [Halarcobacter anaerophilus]RXJ63378.1 hypothetical protein CRV06_06800 [Halarcobacter anaerophilus]